MRRNWKIIIITILIWAGFTLLCLAATSAEETTSKHPTAFELLDRYAENQEKLRSIIAKTEEIIINTQSNQPIPKFTRWNSEIRIDGKRTLWRFYRWLNLPDKDTLTPPEDAHYYHFHLWDGKIYFEYNKHLQSNNADVFVSANEKGAKYILNHAHNGAPFLGVRYSDCERIDVVLRQAISISVRDKLEQIGPTSNYVIDAKTKSGNYTVWIDPEHSYNIAKVDVRVEPNHLYRGRLLKNNESNSLSIKNVRFEMTEGVWIPMEADLYSTSKRQDGPTIHATIHHKITKITLKPDHDVLGSFVPEMENGTNIHLDSGEEYTWQEGMKFVVDEWDGSIKYVPKDWSILVGISKPLPDLKDFTVGLSPADIENKKILLCFFDMEQRPSRNCIMQLAKKAQELKEKDVIVVVIQASKIDESTRNKYVKKYNIFFPVGIIQGKEEQTRFNWGVRSLPWLILTDTNQLVRAEGFSLQELNTKLKQIVGDQVIAGSILEPIGKHALSFDGADDYLHIEANPKLTLKPPFTIEMWIKPDFSEVDRAKTSEKILPYLSLMHKGKRLFQEKKILAGGFMMFVGPLSQTDGKYHSNLYLGNADGFLYQVDLSDGEPLQPARPGWLYVSMGCTRETYIPVPEQPLIIGQNIVPSFFPFKGDIAEIRIWSGVHSGDQVAIYRNKPLKGNEPGLVACWDFKRSNSQIVYDISSNSNHARLGSAEGPDDADPKWIDLKSP